MGFASGSVSFRRYAVVGKSPASIDQALLDKLAEHALKPQEMGVPDEAEYGWSGGRHVLDDAFDFETNVYADALVFGLRIDTHSFPGGLKKAYEAQESAALAKGNKNQKGFLSKAQKKEVKETVQKRVEDELRTGKYRRSKVSPLLWDVQNNTLYGSAAGKTFEMLAELFQRSFELDLIPVSAGSLALRSLEPHGKRREYEDLRPTRFVQGPEGESQHPEYPWVLKGPEPKDFLGNEFLMWLWHEADAREGVVKLGGGREVAYLIDRSLDLDCAYGMSGRDGLRGDGPGRMPEAREGVRMGKVPRKAGLLLDVDGQDYTLGFNPETFAVASAKLPDIEKAEGPRQEFEERIGLIRDLCRGMDEMFEAFLKVRTSGGWEPCVADVRRWIMQTPPPTVIAA